jgi:predicted MFS family arabinose efflux permease
MAQSADDHHFVRALRTSPATNTPAYGFSLSVAGSFAALMNVHGEPTWLELYLFLIGSCAGFATVNALSTRLFRKEAPDEPELVISLATSLSAFSVCAAVGAATGIAFAFSSWLAWPLGALAFTLVYLVGVGVEIGIAAHQHPQGGPAGRRRRRRGKQ